MLPGIQDNAGSIPSKPFLQAQLCRDLHSEAQAVQCDVCNDAQQSAVFDQHVKAFGSLDLAVLNAGIAELASRLAGDMLKDDRWQQTLDVDLRAAMKGTALAAQAMLAQKTQGVIILTASSGGLFPMPMAPAYAAAKAGLVHFTRSLAPRLHKRGIRLCALCPQQVDTALVSIVCSQHCIDVRKCYWLHVQVTEAAHILISNEACVGTVLLVHAKGAVYEWHPPQRNLKFVKKLTVASRQAMARWAASSMPAQRQKVQVHRLSNNFQEATRLATEPMPSNPPAGHVLVRNAFAGVNASDINYSSGRQATRLPKKAKAALPFDAGFEAVGVVAAVAPGVEGKFTRHATCLQVGDPVACMSYGSFSDYQLISTRQAMPVPVVAPEIVALLTSGLTASIALEQAGRMGTGETVLVTAAAGGTGQFAVQLAKAAGNTVIATCSSQEKADMLRGLGADRVINYKTEQLGKVLKKEFPKGMDLIYESVGGEMFEQCVKSLAVHGRIVVIGAMSQLLAADGAGWSPSQHTGLTERLLYRSATVAGFFLLSYAKLYNKHLQKLSLGFLSGKLKVHMDPTPFRQVHSGLGSVISAVNHLQSGQSMGKVFVQMADELPSQETSKL
eukprot:jgi/Astpho2/4125/e_gw1.00063.43.1_t